MSKINVLYSFPLRLGTPGIGMTAWHQVCGLLREDVRIKLYCGSLEKQIQQLDELRQTLVPFGIKLPLRLLGRNGTMQLHDRIVSKALRRIHRKSPVDIVHCWPSGSIETLKTARELGIKTVLERPCAHTRFVCEVTARECDRLGIKLNTHYSLVEEKKIAREEKEFAIADKLLCPSKHVVKTFLEKGFKEEQLLRERYGYDPDGFSPGGRSDDDNTHSFTMVYVGECHPLKGLHFALQAWVASEASKKGRFYICGRFLPEYHEFLKPLLAHPTVECIGFTRDVAKIMRKCDSLVLPSLSEGCPLVTCEARACGCVLLVSDAASEVCEHMKNGLVHDAGDVDTLQKHIDLLASDKELLGRLRASSIADINKVTWSETAKSMVTAYRQCLRVDR
jgi:glycosyltransferase involved in cell wall biosynthesis